MAAVEKTEEPPRQQFRSSVDGSTISIQAQIDPVTGSYIIPWQRIQDSFPTLRSLRHGDDNVCCLVAPETLEDLLPRGIHYYPNVVLDVIQDDLPLIGPETGDSDKPHCLIPSQTISVLNLDDDSGDKTEPLAGSLVRKSTNLLPETNFNKFFVLWSKDTATQATCTSLYESYVKAMTRGQDQQAESIKHHIDVVMVSLIKEMARNRDSMMKEMAENQAQLLEKDRESKEMQENMVATLKRMHEMQEETLNRLATIQNRVQALLTLTYELFEYPIPRLFIVLPTQRSLSDRLNPRDYKFKLYFLCECGEHTKKKFSSNKVSHHIHLAKHIGYDLLRPTEFFQKYGSDLLTMMEMIKLGLGIAGIIVPTLAQLKVLDGIGEIKDQLDFTEKTFAPLLDDSISHVKSCIGQDLPDADLEGKSDLMAQEAWEGPDLRQLMSYLSKADGARTLGNLYRTVTEEGHVKWVCSDHYHEGYVDSIQRRFADIVDKNRGEFKQDLGQVTISLSTPLTAQEFYEALKRTKGVNELTINPLWDATKSDIQQLCDAILESNVSILGIGGRCFDGPTSDFFKRSSRFDPFIQLLASGKLQSFTIKDCPRFMDRISNIASPVALKLRVLNLCYHYSAKEFKTVRQKIVDLLQQIPSLTEATVGCLDIDEMFALLPIQQLRQLPVLHLQQMRYSNKATLVLSNGVVKHMDLRADNVPELAYFGFLRQFEMVAGEISLTDLERLLGANMGLTTLRLKAENLFEYIFLIDTLMPTRCDPLLVIFKNNKDQFVKMKFWDTTKVPPAEPKGKWIQLAHSMVHVREWGHTSYNFRHINSDAAVFLSQLEEMIDGENTVLLDLDISSLTTAGIKAVRKTMTYLRPEVCHMVFKRFKQEWAHCYDFDSICWSRLLKLEVSGEDMAIWLQKPGSASQRGLMRSSWYLQHLTVQGQGGQAFLSDDLTDWLAYMASRGYSQPLKGLTISNARFSHEGWRTILRSINYSNLHFLHLQQCDLTGALPGSRNDATYTAADLCRHVGLGTGHQERAAKFVLAQGTGDDLTFKRKSNSTVQALDNGIK
ncbi:hypothetical protein BGZ51_002475 [Haplosporangium sp. Z 767]|nr:hypothetical protein BGZ51_002475 [Haplosporangium sp. Z 767]